MYTDPLSISEFNVLSFSLVCRLQTPLSDLKEVLALMRQITNITCLEHLHVVCVCMCYTPCANNWAPCHQCLPHDVNLFSLNEKESFKFTFNYNGSLVQCCIYTVLWSVAYIIWSILIWRFKYTFLLG